MATVHEAKASRDLSARQIGPNIAKLENALNTKNVKLVQKYIRALNDLAKLIEQRHLQYMVKAKLDIDDPEAGTYMTDLDEVMCDPLERAECFLEEAAEAKRNERARQTTEEGYQLQKEISDAHTGAIDQRLTTILNMLQCNALTEPEIVRAEVEMLERKCAETLHKFIQQVESLASSEKLLLATTHKTQVETMIADKVLSVRNAASSKGIRSIPSTSRENSPTRTSNIIRPKQLEFPRFGGDIRTYMVFKRDFSDMVANTDVYSDAQLSHILRVECLQGEAKLMCRNIYELSEIWSRLDDVYYDPQKLVELITRQISDTKKVMDRDYTGFIKFVDGLERAYHDLGAMDSKSVMDNAMTYRVVEKKLPDWVQMALTVKKSEGVEGSDQFPFLLEFLRTKRKEARKLVTLRDLDSGNSNEKDKKRGSAHAANGSATPSNNKSWTCLVDSCRNNNRHFLSECRDWLNLDQDGKGKVVLDKKLCILCFSPGHLVVDCPKKAKWKRCDVQGCNKWHSRSLHGAKVPGLALSMSCDGGAVWLMLQEIRVDPDLKCNAMWDSGATVSLVTFSFAEKARLTGSCCSFQLTGVGNHTSNAQTYLYKITIIDVNDEKIDIYAYGIEKIIHHQNPPVSDELLMELQQDIKQPDTPNVDLLIGISVPHLHPELICVIGSTGLYKSRFGTGWLIAGGNGGVNSVTATTGNVDFLTAEGLGVQMPKRCKCAFNVKSVVLKHATYPGKRI